MVFRQLEAAGDRRYDQSTVSAADRLQVRRVNHGYRHHRIQRAYIEVASELQMLHDETVFHG